MVPLFERRRRGRVKLDLSRRSAWKKERRWCDRDNGIRFKTGESPKVPGCTPGHIESLDHYTIPRVLIVESQSVASEFVVLEGHCRTPCVTMLM